MKLLILAAVAINAVCPVLSTSVLPFAGQEHEKDGVKFRIKEVIDEKRLHRSLGTFQVFSSEAALLAATGAASYDWTVNYDNMAAGSSFREGNTLDVTSTDSNVVYSLFTTGVVPTTFEGSPIPFGQVSAIGGSNAAWITQVFNQANVIENFSTPAKAWGTELQYSQGNGQGTNMEIQVTCPSGTMTFTPPSTGFWGIYFEDEAIEKITFEAIRSGSFATYELWFNKKQVGIDSDPTPPPPAPGGFGDPHFLTWGNKYFDFMGACDLVLVDAPGFGGGLGFRIHVRTTIRHDYSYITSVALQIGDEILEVVSYGDYVLNSVDTAQVGASNMMMAGYPVVHEKKLKKRDKFDVMIGLRTNVTIAVYKDLVSVSFAGGNAEEFGSSVGLMGNFHNGRLLARDGKTVMDNMDVFAQEWQVHEEEPILFQAARPPQHPMEKCRLPADVQMQARRRLGESSVRQEAAKKACAHLNGNMKEACIYDVIATGDVGAAANY